MTKLRGLFRLSASDWITLMAAYCWLFRARRTMQALRSGGWQTAINPERPASPETGDVTCRLTAPQIQRRVRFIRLAARYPKPWALCLQRSLALREWLERDQVFTELRIGVYRDDQQFLAHAWLEQHGNIINDHPNWVRKFTLLPTERGSNFEPILGLLGEARQ